MQPVGPAELEGCFGTENRVTKLCHTRILCKNSGHHGFIGYDRMVEIVHCKAPLFRVHSVLAFFTYWWYYTLDSTGMLDSILSINGNILIATMLISTFRRRISV